MKQLLACAIVLLVCPRIGHGDPGNEAECDAVFKQAVELTEHGQLVKAADALKSCEAAACGDAIRGRCILRGELILRDTPTVVFAVTNDDDAPVADVRVAADGKPFASHADGRAIAIDPGMHEFTFYRGKTLVGTKKLLVVQGQRNRVIAVKMRPQTASVTHPTRVEPHPSSLRLDASARTERRRAYLPSYVAFGVGAIGIGGAALFTMWGRKDNERLAECTPGCPQASVDHIHHLYIASDISLGIGLAGVAVGSWLAWRTHSHYALSVQPTASGAVASVSGAL